MFHSLSEKLQQAFSSLAGKKKLTEENLVDAVREVRMALLEADVHYGVTKAFVKRVKEKSIGQDLITSVTPTQQFIKIVHDELVALMGEEKTSLRWEGKPAVALLCGLQGAGKTTHCAKLAHLLKGREYGKRPLIAACDLQRPAAVEQLRTLGEQIDVPVFFLKEEKDPLVVAAAAWKKAKEEGYDVLIVDTAGRLHLDEELMTELERLVQLLHPQMILFVANAMTGQDAVNSARAFDQRLGITGSILTMLDGDARGGAAISIREVTQKPLLFEGVGEKVEDLQPFHPRSMADRILGMGDTINLVRKAEEHMDEAAAQALEQKMRKAAFTYEDYLQQMQMIKKMGSVKSLLKMLPGVGQHPALANSEGEMKKAEAVILSMTPPERKGKEELIMGRRRRIAKGSGVPLEEVNRLVKGFKGMKQFMKRMPSKKQMEKLIGGFTWR